MSLLTQFYPGPGGGSEPVSVAGGVVTGDGGGAAVIVRGGNATASMPATYPAGFSFVACSDGSRYVQTSSLNPAIFTQQPGTLTCSINSEGPASVYLVNLSFGVLGHPTSNVTINLLGCTEMYGGGWNGNASGLTITAPILVTISGFYAWGIAAGANILLTAAKLSDVTQSSFFVRSGANLTASATILSQSSVDNILTTINNNSTGTQGTGSTINLGGGCVAPSSAVTTTVVPALVAKGYSVTTN
jgi:hypothetical protein